MVTYAYIFAVASILFAVKAYLDKDIGSFFFYIFVDILAIIYFLFFKENPIEPWLFVGVLILDILALARLIQRGEMMD